VNDFGKHDNGAVQPKDQAPELTDQLNLLESIDRRITPEYLAGQFRDFLDAISEDMLAGTVITALQAAQDDAAEAIDRARREADIASRKAETVLADADARADAELQRAAGIVAGARRRAEQIIAGAEKDAERIAAGAVATSPLESPASYGDHQPQVYAAVATAMRAQHTAAEPTAAAVLTISLLPDQPAELREPAESVEDEGKGLVTGSKGCLITIAGIVGGALSSLAVALTSTIAYGLAALAAAEAVLAGSVLIATRNNRKGT
jgi:hypothetical protein